MVDKKTEYLAEVNSFVEDSKHLLRDLLQRFGWKEETLLLPTNRTNQKDKPPDCGDVTSQLNPQSTDSEGERKDAVSVEHISYDLLDLNLPLTKKDEEKSILEEVAARRDAKRRRISYKNKVHTKNKSHTEIMREVITQQMEVLEEWVGGKGSETGGRVGEGEEKSSGAKEEESEKPPTDLIELPSWAYAHGNPHALWKKIPDLLKPKNIQKSDHSKGRNFEGENERTKGKRHDSSRTEKNHSLSYKKSREEEDAGRKEKRSRQEEGGRHTKDFRRPKNYDYKKKTKEDEDRRKVREEEERSKRRKSSKDDEERILEERKKRGKRREEENEDGSEEKKNSRIERNREVEEADDEIRKQSKKEWEEAERKWREKIFKELLDSEEERKRLEEKERRKSREERPRETDGRIPRMEAEENKKRNGSRPRGYGKDRGNGWSKEEYDSNERRKEKRPTERIRGYEERNGK